MGRLASALIPLLCLCAGCLTTDEPDVKRWTLARGVPAPAAVRAPEGGAGAFGATRLGSITVCAPYDREAFTVRRGDGSVAFDHYNVFADTPSALLRRPMLDSLQADGRFGSVVGQGSIVTADAQVEVRVTDLSLDCREAGRRTASAELAVDVVRTGRTGPRTVVSSSIGSHTVDASSGDYTKAFSQAVDGAIHQALEGIRIQPPSAAARP